MSLSKRWIAGVTAVATALALTACSGTDSSSTGSKTLTLGSVLAPSTLAADSANWGNESPYLQAAYDTLVREDPSGKIVPWLAKDWTLDASKLVLTMNLRDDVTFSDGTKFDATAAAKNLLRFRDGTSPNRALLAPIKDVTAVNPTTLKITLSTPEPALLYYLAQNAGLMASPEHFGAADEKTNPIGSGPYILDTKATVAGSKYVYTKNPNYWAKDDQHYDKVIVTTYSTPQAQVSAVQGRQVNGSALLSPTATPQVKAAGYDTLYAEVNWQGLMLLDRAGKLNKALGDVRVRQAIAYAIDRQALMKGPGQGYGTLTGQVFGKNNPAFDASLDNYYSYDPAKAKKLLAEAGYPNGITLNMPLIQTGTTAMYDLVKQYLDDAGIKVNYTPTALNDIIAALLAPKYAASQFTLIQATTPWQAAATVIAPSAVWNPFHSQDPKIDSLLKVIQTGSEAESNTAAKELNKYVVEQAWFVPFFRPKALFAVDKKTEVVPQADNAYPYLYNIKPKG